MRLRQTLFIAGLSVLLYAPAPAQLNLSRQPDFFAAGASNWSVPLGARDGLGAAFASGDFNNDGFTDLAVGAPTKMLQSASEAGAVHILFGAATGLQRSGSQVFNQSSPETGDQLGRALAAGDFNNDGFQDLAVAADLEDMRGVRDAGGVYVVYGSTSGLSVAGSQFWEQASEGIAASPADGDRFGFALTVGDFNGDQYADLVIGSPWEDEFGAANSGAVHTIYGTASGLAANSVQVWNRNSIEIDGLAGDRLGWSVAAGDFNRDGFEDLAVGLPGRRVGSAERRVRSS